MDTTANKCKKCPPGTFNGNAGKRFRCSDCEAGKFSAAGSATCSQCEAGTFSVEGSSICSACGIGKRSLEERSGCGE